MHQSQSLSLPSYLVGASRSGCVHVPDDGDSADLAQVLEGGLHYRGTRVVRDGRRRLPVEAQAETSAQQVAILVKGDTAEHKCGKPMSGGSRGRGA